MPSASNNSTPKYSNRGLTDVFDIRDAACGRADCARFDPFGQSREITMKRFLVPGLTMLAGVAIGAFAVQGLHAQAKPPSYVVIDITKMNDPEGFKAVT